MSTERIECRRDTLNLKHGWQTSFFFQPEYLLIASSYISNVLATIEHILGWKDYLDGFERTVNPFKPVLVVGTGTESYFGEAASVALYIKSVGGDPPVLARQRNYCHVFNPALFQCTGIFVLVVFPVTTLNNIFNGFTIFSRSIMIQHCSQHVEANSGQALRAPHMITKLCLRYGESN